METLLEKRQLKLTLEIQTLESAIWVSLFYHMDTVLTKVIWGSSLQFINHRTRSHTHQTCRHQH